MDKLLFCAQWTNNGEQHDPNTARSHTMDTTSEPTAEPLHQPGLKSVSCGNYTRVNSSTRSVLWLLDSRHGCMHAGGVGVGGVPTSERTVRTEATSYLALNT